MKLLFVVALPVELKIIKQEIKKLEIREFQVDFLLLWVGNYNTIYNIKEYIERNWKPDFIINLWVCWKTLKEKYDFIQIYRIKNLSDNKEKICPVYFEFWKLQSIACSELIITNENDLNWEKFVDMESFWVDFVSSKEKIPYIIIKIPFDLIWENSKNIDLKEFDKSFWLFPYNELVFKINNYLQKNIKNYEPDFNFYKNYFKLTFSELEILKKNYNKFVAYNLDFKDFFEQNKNLSKDKFLEKINKK